MACGNACAGVVDGFGVLRSPASELLQDGHLFVGDRAVGAGPDVEQEVASETDTVDEHAQQRHRALVVGVVGAVAPRVVHCHAGLPPLRFGPDNRNAQFGGVVVAVALDARVDNHVGVGLAEHRDDLRGVPLLGRVLPVAVEPVEVGLPGIVELAQLGEVEVDEVLPAFGFVGNPVAVGPVSVDDGIIVAGPVNE